MYIKVKVFAGMRHTEVVKEKNSHYKIYVREPAERNMANEKVRELLAIELGVNVSKVRLISGHHMPQKMFSVTDDD